MYKVVSGINCTRQKNDLIQPVAVGRMFVLLGFYKIINFENIESTGS